MTAQNGLFSGSGRSTRFARRSSARSVAALRRSVLERAFRGELVPQDPSDEPASVLLDRIRAERSVGEPPGLRRRARR